MKALILCGVYASENEKEVLAQAKASVDFAANQFQQKLISGMKQVCQDVQVISAPFIGPYPTASKTIHFTGFEKNEDEYIYVPFQNLWGYRNISRERMIKKALEEFVSDNCDEKLILLYSAHTPFLRAANYAKQCDPRIKLCMIIPDLPMYMNLSENRSSLYNVAKRIDMTILFRHFNNVDAFVLLTEHMKEMLPIDGKPVAVIEGIVDDNTEITQTEQNSSPYKNIVYAGGINEKYGLRALIHAFESIPNLDYRLVLCGAGDCVEYIRNQCAIDSRICYLGQITPDEVKKQYNAASILINPRPNSEEYTKYSFPSKLLTYLMTGKPTVAYMLDGMPACYSQYIYEISQTAEPNTAIAEAIQIAMNDSKNMQQLHYSAFLKHAKEKLTAKSVALQILELFKC